MAPTVSVKLDLSVPAHVVAAALYCGTGDLETPDVARVLRQLVTALADPELASDLQEALARFASLDDIVHLLDPEPAATTD